MQQPYRDQPPYLNQPIVNYPESGAQAPAPPGRPAFQQAPPPEHQRLLPPPEPPIVSVIAALVGLLVAPVFWWAGYGGLALAIALGVILLALTSAVGGLWRETRTIRIEIQWAELWAQIRRLFDHEAQYTERARLTHDIRDKELDYTPLEFAHTLQSSFGRLEADAARRAEVDPSFRAVLETYRESMDAMGAQVMALGGQMRTLTPEERLRLLIQTSEDLERLQLALLRHKTGAQLDKKKEGHD